MGRFLVPQRSQVVRWRGALEGLLPPDHLARFVWHVVSTLDFRDLEAGYRSVQGRPGRSPYHPRLVAALWVYGMTQRLETAAAIARACRLRDDFRWLAGGWCPSDQTLLNLLTLAPAGLGAIWGQVLGAMHRAGHIDLNVLVEDGTKLRANASPRSFHPAPEIADIIQDLERQLAAKLQAGGEPPSARASQAEVRALERRLARAKQAAAELAQRRERRPPDPAAPSGGQAIDPSISETSPASGPLPPKFGRAAFSHDAERDVLVCPAGESLPFIGIYREPPRSPFRLYRARRTVCPGCRLKAECTAAPRRSVKIPVEPPTPSAGPAAAPANPPPAREAPGEAPAPLAAPPDAPPSGPRASLTEPEAVMMLATSVKRWEPSYNADLTVTRQGLIVHQFLTKTPTDFHHFRHALPAVLSTLGRPEAWVGDGHYSTQENVLLAHRAGVVLYAPLPDSDTAAPPVPAPGATASAAAAAPDPGRPRKFCSRDFRPAPDKDALICPAGEELRLIGIYAGSIETTIASTVAPTVGHAR